MYKRFSATMLATMLAFAPAAMAEKTAHTKAEIEQIVDNYIMENPDIVMRAVEKIQSQHAEKQNTEAKAVIEKKRQSLYHSDTTPYIGAKDAKVVVVEFFDYKCGVCHAMYKTIREFHAKNPDVKVVFKHFPLPMFGPDSPKLARLSLAVYAKQPKQFFDFHAAMMEHKGNLTIQVGNEWVKKHISNPDVVLQYAESEATAKTLNEEVQLAQGLQVEGTPMLIINDEIIRGAVPVEELTKKVQEKQKNR